MKTAARKPLKRSILVSSVLFITALCLVLSLLNYSNYRRIMYRHYETYIENILRYTAAGIDTDDLAECVRTGVESEKYHELQGFLDQVKANVDLHFLYVIVPLNTEPTDNIQNVIAAVSEYEYEHMADQLVHLNMLTGDSYSPATARKYLKAYESGELSFFEESSEWGDDYTGLLPLYDSQGSRFAALCMDVDVRSIHTELRTQAAVIIGVTALIGLLYTFIFVFWTDNNIVRPIALLENSVTEYARSSHEQKELDALVLTAPEIHTGNEVESLAHSIVKMSEDVRDSVRNMIRTEHELERMQVLAHRDALTHVGNNTAYVQYTENLRIKLWQEHIPLALLIADVNRLKDVNDSYGHDKGDLYLKGCCGVLCDTFRHSPIFRVGVVVIQADLVRLLLADVFRHQINILHQLDRIAERIGVHPLHQIGFNDRHTGSVIADVIGLIRAVHVALAHFLVGKERSADVEAFSDLLQFARHF